MRAVQCRVILLFFGILALFNAKLQTELPVEIDVEAEAGGDVVWDPTRQLPVHLTVLGNPSAQKWC